MICPNCKTHIDENDDEVRYCPKCKFKLVNLDFEKDFHLSGILPPDPFPTKDFSSEYMSIIEAILKEKIPSSSPAEILKAVASNRPEGQAGMSKKPSRRVTLYTLADHTSRDNNDIEIEYAVNRLIRTEGNVNFCLRIKKLNSSLKMVNAWVKINDGNEQNSNIYRDLNTYRDWTFENNCFENIFVFHHGKGGGDIVFDYYVMGIFENRVEFYMFKVQHHIIVDGQSAQQINQTFIIERSANTAINGNSDISSAMTGNEFIDLVNMEEPYYRPMANSRIDRDYWRPEYAWLNHANYDYNYFPTERLTLIYTNENKQKAYIHLCSKDNVNVGRSFKSNDFTITDWIELAASEGNISRSVSRYHGSFVYKGSMVSYSNLSSRGTCISHNDQRIILGRQEQNPDTGDTKPYELPKEGIISFGKIQIEFKQYICHMRKRNSMGKYFRLCKCCEGNSVKAMLLRRYSDRFPEVFLCLWECFDLGVVSPKLEGLTVYHRNGGFLIENRPLSNEEEASLYVLYPGFKMQLENKDVLLADKPFPIIPN